MVEKINQLKPQLILASNPDTKSHLEDIHKKLEEFHRVINLIDRRLALLQHKAQKQAV